MKIRAFLWKFSGISDSFDSSKVVKKLFVNKNANINKIVIIYPKSNLDEYLGKLDEKEILYKKNEHQYRLQLP